MTETDQTPNETLLLDALAKMMRNQEITFFLGAAASLAGAPETVRLPGSQELARTLKQYAKYPGPDTDPLTKISQYFVEGVLDRDFLLSCLKQIFHSDLSADYACAVVKFLASMPRALVPNLIVTTNYDTLIERVLELREIPYICVSHIFGKTKYAGRLIHYNNISSEISKANIATTRYLEEHLEMVLRSSSKPVIIYKMHGSAAMYLSPGERLDKNLHFFNSVVLTEQDYIDFLDKDVMKALPTQIQRLMLKSRFLFLGYSLQDWNFRVLLHRLRERHSDSALQHWACLLEKDGVEKGFWNKRGITLYEMQLEAFLDKLGTALATTPI